MHNEIYSAASDYILKELFRRHTELKLFYRPDNSPGAKIADPNWIVNSKDGRISAQVIIDDKAVRIDVAFKVGNIVVTYYTRAVEVKPQLNNNIMVLRERLPEEQEVNEEEYTLALADPKSLPKTVTLISEKLQKIL